MVRARVLGAGWDDGGWWDLNVPKLSRQASGYRGAPYRKYVVHLGHLPKLGRHATCHGILRYFEQFRHLDKWRGGEDEASEGVGTKERLQTILS